MLIRVLLGFTLVLSVSSDAPTQTPTPPDFAAFVRAITFSSPEADLDGDGKVGFSDFIRFARGYHAAKQTTGLQKQVVVPSADLRAFAEILFTVRQDGLPVSNIQVAFTRSISGKAEDFAWRSITDSTGTATVQVQTGTEDASGYYRARATDPVSAKILGEWGSIPINQAQRNTLDLVSGGKALVRALTDLEPAPRDSSTKTQPDPTSVPDRIFMKANQWISNGTADQLEGFNVLRLSSFKPVATLRAVTDTLNRKLMLGLSLPYAPPDTMWPGNVLASYPDTGPLAAYESWLDSLRNIHHIPVYAVGYNQEVPYRLHARYGTPETVSAVYAELIHEYRRILSKFYPDAKFWVFGGPHESLFQERIHTSCDWELLTSGPNAIDVCYIGYPLDVLAGNLDAYKATLRQEIELTKEVANGKDVIWQIMTYGFKEGDASFTAVRNNYHHKWDVFRDLIRYTRQVMEDVNNKTVPITYYQTHYHGAIDVDGKPVAVYYSLDGYGTPPETDLPWPDGGAYPARLWYGDQPWPWFQQENIANRWEAEFVANFLIATGYEFARLKIDTDTVWNGQIILLGDMEITNGATLRIEPGTTVSFRPRTDLYKEGKDVGRAEIRIREGSLVADGENGLPITFRSSSNPPGTGDWYGIRNLSGRLILNNCLLRDATIGVEPLEGDVIGDVRFENNGVDILP